MQLTPLPAVTLRDLALANPDSVDRSPGLHVTDVIYNGIMPVIDRAKFGPGKKTFDEANSENWQEAGFIWEELLSRIFARRAVLRDTEGVTRFRPGEITRDRIIGSPDALVYGLADYPDVPEFAPVLEEYKCTWKSSKGFDLYDKRYFGWLLQIQAYCVLVGTTEARLYVLHINGGYDGFIPEVRPHRLQFTDRELADTWRSITNTAKAKNMYLPDTGSV
jgi:hypothetical protein